MSWLSPSPEATRAAAAALARTLRGRGLVVALVGPLGAGKTAFVKGLAEGLGLDPEAVASPTFVLVSEYPRASGLRLAHVDLFRVESEAELEAVGFRDLLAPDVLLAVEWADRFPAALPRDRLEVRMTRPAAGEGTQRELLAVALGPVAAQVLARWRAAHAPGAPGALEAGGRKHEPGARDR